MYSMYTHHIKPKRRERVKKKQQRNNNQKVEQPRK